ncbi:MAG: DUF1273 family protein [Clostridia bacterium]|nr:DUF1273 family protein [Clostridia bacterium]
MTDIKQCSSRACFTGHRPEKLKTDTAKIIEELAKEIDIAISEGITEFISGMARGVDLWAASLVLERKKDNPSIKLVCAIPYEGFSKSWSDKWQSMYNEACEQADLVKVFYRYFTYASFQERNRWMVDNSARIIAVYNGEKGGTENTLEYARKCGTRVCVIQG